MNKPPTDYQNSIPFEQIHKDWTFIKLPTLKWVLGMKIVVEDVTQFTDKEGIPFITPSGKPAMNLIQNVVTQFFTLEEYHKIIAEQEKRHFS